MVLCQCCNWSQKVYKYWRKPPFPHFLLRPRNVKVEVTDIKGFQFPKNLENLNLSNHLPRAKIGFILKDIRI